MKHAPSRKRAAPECSPQYNQLAECKTLARRLHSALTGYSGPIRANRPARASILIDDNLLQPMRPTPTVLLIVAHAASALQPVSVQRRALLGGAAAALVVTPQEKARAAGLEQFKSLPVHKSNCRGDGRLTG